MTRIGQSSNKGLLDSRYVKVAGTETITGVKTLTTPKMDVIAEATAAAGVTVDGLKVKDGGFDLGSDARGDIYYRGASGLARLVAGTSGYFLKTLGADVDPAWAVASGLQVKVGTTTRDMTTATGTQAITGVGFTPKVVILFANVNGTAKSSIGFSDGTTHQCFYDYQAGAADTWSTHTYLVFIFQSGTDLYGGVISSWDADGFTIGWTKTGSPTGTLVIGYLAMG